MKISPELETLIETDFSLASKYFSFCMHSLRFENNQELEAYVDQLLQELADCKALDDGLAFDYSFALLNVLCARDAYLEA